MREKFRVVQRELTCARVQPAVAESNELVGPRKQGGCCLHGLRGETAKGSLRELGYVQGAAVHAGIVLWCQVAGSDRLLCTPAASGLVRFEMGCGA